MGIELRTVHAFEQIQQLALTAAGVHFADGEQDAVLFQKSAPGWDTVWRGAGKIYPQDRTIVPSGTLGTMVLSDNRRVGCFPPLG